VTAATSPPARSSRYCSSPIACAAPSETITDELAPPDYLLTPVVSVETG
jgi:hypothetical protein